MSAKTLSCLFYIVICLHYCTVLNAQANRTWVSGVGDDVNPCSRTAPCKTFAGALAKTSAGGEINVIDPAGYGGIAITKSITIDGAGSHASIVSSLLNGIVINAPDGVVTLRRLSINGVGNGFNGIVILAAKKVIIEYCYLANFTQKGIDISPADSCTVILNNVTVQNADNALSITNGRSVVIIDDCRFQAITKSGINLVSGQATISNSRISDCHTGINLVSGQATVSNSGISNCHTGINTEANTVVRISQNVITGNDIGIRPMGSVSSLGNNLIAGNKTETSPTSLIKSQ